MRTLGLLSLLLAIAFPMLVSAQATGLIVGIVEDSTGAVVPAAEVRAINELTGLEWTAQSDAAGRFNFPSMPVGQYRVEVTLEGFKSFNSGSFRLDADQSRQVTASLEVGQVTESVTVEGAVTQVETVRATLREMVDERRITELPLNGRNPMQLILLVPGVNSSGGGSLSQNGGFSVNGSRATSNNFLLDGGDNNDSQQNRPAIVPNPDALEEFSIQTNNFGAEHGRSTGGLVSAVTKAGTNEFHGSAFWFVRNDRLDAAGFDTNRFGLSKSPLRRNQYGGTVGGPIVENKTFFFFSYEGAKERAATTFSGTTVPTAAMRNGDLSATGKKFNDPFFLTKYYQH
ncbi:MAG: TonB-dependent receptor [bacterium]|nr:TonB-dependent receptor [bacterium]